MFAALRKYRTIKMVGWRVHFSSDAPAYFAGSLSVSQEISRMHLPEKASPGVLPYCAVFPYIYTKKRVTQ
jgi:hypothetical protein